MNPVLAMVSSPEFTTVQMRELVDALFPICRSITGAGLRETLRYLQRWLPLELVEVPTGTPVLDWTVPREWNIRDAYVKNERGERVIDFQASNLHVVHYSVPVRERMSLAELRPYLFSLPDQPDAIPYRTSYYRESWGFCLSQRVLESLPEGLYEVCIDSTLEPGSLSYGECLLPGESDEEVLISSHCCHPSLANDNLSGIAVAVALYHFLHGRNNRYSYRFVFAPVTIGALTWLALNESRVGRIKHGLVLTGVGDGGPATYKRSRRGNAEVDRAAEQVLRGFKRAHQLRNFMPYGYDERQYCSPGFDLPVGCLMRTPHGEYKEYHTSGDNPDFLNWDALLDTVEICKELFQLLEQNAVYYNQKPKGEPQLGRRGLYQGLAGRTQLPGYELALLWVLNLSDGRHSLLDIAQQAGLDFAVIQQAAQALLAAGLLAGTPPQEQAAQ